MHHSSVCATTLSIFAAVACQTTVNVTGATDTSEKETETGPGSTAGTGDPTGNPGTSNPSTTDPNTTDPSATNSSTTDANTTEAGTTNPNTTEGATTEPGTTGTDGASSDVSTTGGVNMGCGEGWTRAREITIMNEPEKPLTDYQIMVTVVWDDDMKVDFSDLRFIDAMGAPLPYWIEDYTAPVEATVWVKVPAIAAAGDTTITMCYGNPGAPEASDGEATFVFFDGFDGDSLDAGKWATTSPVSLSGGILTITNGAVYSKVSPGTTPNLMLEARYSIVSNSGNEDALLIMSATQNGHYPSIWAWLGGSEAWAGNGMPVFAGFFPGTCCNKPNGDIFGVAVDEGNAYAFANRNDSLAGMGTWKQPFFVGLGYTWMKDSGDQDVRDMKVQWVLVRKFTSIPPACTVGAEQVL